MDWWYGVRPNRSHCPALSQNLDCQKCRLTQCTIFQDPGDIFKLFFIKSISRHRLKLDMLGSDGGLSGTQHVGSASATLTDGPWGRGWPERGSYSISSKSSNNEARRWKTWKFYRYHIHQAPLGLTWGFVYFLFKSSSSIFFLAWLESSCSIANWLVELT